MEPIAEALGLPVSIDGRVIEAANYLEGLKVSFRGAAARTRATWWYFRNPLKPSWGEPYTEIVARMRLAMRDAAEAAAGHEAVIVSHQLPIWMARCDAEGRRLVHDPRKRECTLASVTSFTYPGLPGDLGRLPRARRRPAEAAPDQEVRRGGLGP